MAALVSSFCTWAALCFRGSGACIQCRMRPPSTLVASVGVWIRFMGKDCAYPSVVLVLVCSLPDVGVWIRFYGHGLRLSLCGFGARVFLARRWYADTAHWHGFACLSVVLVLVCSLPDVGMRIRPLGMDCFVSPWSWCSCVPCQTLVCGFGFWAWIALSFRGPGASVFIARRWYADSAFGHGLLCLSVVLVLVCSLPDVGVRIRPLGMDCFVSPWSWCSCVQCYGVSSCPAGSTVAAR